MSYPLDPLDKKILEALQQDASASLDEIAKKTGKRIFLMAPIHHHFEKMGWEENKVTVRFWIIAFITNLIAILSIKIR